LGTGRPFGTFGGCNVATPPSALRFLTELTADSKIQ
jgi:hypothetical protein